MSASDWFRALQVPVLPVSVGPALVGSLLGAGSAGHLDAGVAVLVVLSLLLIQLAANLQKGLVESADLKETPARPGSAFVFDAGAVGRTGVGRARLRAATLGLFGAGGAVGVAVVLLRNDPVLLLFGGLGAALAYAYSAPPLKLSYRGVGEAATFVAFGPLMVWGAFRAQFNPPPTLPDPWFGLATLAPALLPGIAFGLLAAWVSFARYFPPQTEDRAKGKRTPVVRFGAARSSAAVLGLALVAALVLSVWTRPYVGPCQGWSFAATVGGLDAVLVAAALSAAVLGSLSYRLLRASDPATVERGVAVAVVAHLLVSTLLALYIGAPAACVFD